MFYAIVTDEAYKLALQTAWPRPEPLERLTAARGETIAFQIIVRSDSGRFQLNVGTDPRFSENGAVAFARFGVKCPFASRMYLEGMVTDDDGVEKADRLLSQPVVEYPAGTAAAIWVEVDIPEDAAPGEAMVEIAMFEGVTPGAESPAKTLGLLLEVFDVALPREKSFFLDLWQHPCALARAYGVPLWSDRHFTLLEKMLRSLAPLGQKSVTLVVSEAPWRGQGCFRNRRYPTNLYEHSIVSVTREKGGLRLDFTAMQRYIDLCADCGIKQEIALYGLVNLWDLPGFDEAPPCPSFPEPVYIRCFDAATGAYSYLSAEEEICAYIRALEEYFIRTGQIDRVRVAADEPADPARFARSLAVIRREAPAFRFKAAINHAEFIEQFCEDFDAFAPSLQSVCACYNPLLEYHETMPEKEFLWYVCCSPRHPNTYLGSNLLEARFIGTYTDHLGLDGFLRWTYCCWPENIWQELRYGDWPAGDMNLVYPAADGGILFSLRWKALRRGIEDYECLRLLRQAGRLDVVERVHRLLVKKPDTAALGPADWDTDGICSLCYGDYALAREWMLRALEEET